MQPEALGQSTPCNFFLFLVSSMFLLQITVVTVIVVTSYGYTEARYQRTMKNGSCLRAAIGKTRIT
jgi:hypothetical protein